MVCWLEGLIARVCLVVMLILVCAAGILRSFGHPINWAMDMATFLFAWCCFFSADVAWRNDKLITVEVFIRYLPEKVRRGVKLFHHCLIVVFLVYLIGYGFLLSYTTRVRTFQGIPGFSYTWVTLSMPVGAILLLVTTILKIRKEWAHG